MVKIVGQLAADDQSLAPGQRVRGLLFRKNFQHTLVSPDELPAYSTLKTAKVSHRQLLQYSGSFARLEDELSKTYESTENPADTSAGQKVKVMDVVSVGLEGSGRLAIEWEASPVADTIADHVVAIIAAIEQNPLDAPASPQMTDEEREAVATEVMLQLLREQFGHDNVTMTGTEISIAVDDLVAQWNHEAEVPLSTLTCKHVEKSATSARYAALVKEAAELEKAEKQ
eukprot:SAG31_NODE_13602_length_858_cov_1.071146_1_plen_227_part_10